MSNYQDPNVPQYGTPEYAEWYRQNIDPNYGEPPRKKSHKVRWIVVSVLGVVALAVIGGIAGAASGGRHKNAADSRSHVLSSSSHATTRPPATGKPTPTGAPTTQATHQLIRPAPVRTTPAPVRTTPAPVRTTPVPVRTTPAPARTTAPTTHAPAPAPKPTLTLAEQNAIGAAQEYLNLQGFSRLGLIAQLSSQYGDGYSLADATFAVDHLNVNWDEQAVRSAKQYLSLEHFSRQGLIDQLSSQYGDQYTVAQATYAADHVGF